MRLQCLKCDRDTHSTVSEVATLPRLQWVSSLLEESDHESEHEDNSDEEEKQSSSQPVLPPPPPSLTPRPSSAKPLVQESAQSTSSLSDPTLFSASTILFKASTANSDSEGDVSDEDKPPVIAHPIAPPEHTEPPPPPTQPQPSPPLKKTKTLGPAKRDGLRPRQHALHIIPPSKVGCFDGEEWDRDLVPAVRAWLRRVGGLAQETVVLPQDMHWLLAPQLLSVKRAPCVHVCLPGPRRQLDRLTSCSFGWRAASTSPSSARDAGDLVKGG